MEFLFHVTARENLDAIATSLRLCAASVLVQQARADAHLLTAVRDEPVRLATQAILNDQRPMVWARNRSDIGAYLQLLNKHVFFWPLEPFASRVEKPEHAPPHRRYGIRYLPHGKNWSHVVLRLNRRAVQETNSERGPHYSDRNTGAPDHRTTDFTQEMANLFNCPEYSAVEVVFENHVLIPPDTEVWNRRSDQWQRLSVPFDIDQLSIVQRRAAPPTVRRKPPT